MPDAKHHYWAKRIFDRVVDWWRTGPAALAAAVPVATPYVYFYDLTVLGVSAAFLVRCALTAGFISGEVPGLAIIMGLLLIMPLVSMPVGLLAAAILAVLIVRLSLLDKPRLGLSSAQLLRE